MLEQAVNNICEETPEPEQKMWLKKYLKDWKCLG
jgi:hypothetical protein